MTESRTAFDQMTDAARLALGRGDREVAQATLSAALQTAGAVDLVRSESPDALMRLGTLYRDAGLNAEAEQLFADALSAAEKSFGAHDARLVAPLASLGTALTARGSNDDAEPLLRRALAIAEAHVAPDHPDINVLLNALSRLYLKQGAFARAEPLLERLLALKRSKGEDHPEVATVLASLAMVRQGTGDHEGAEELARKVLRIRERTMAPNHFAVASALELLADACAARGKLGEALRLYQRALSIREQTLGVSHASLRIARERIADLQLQAADNSLTESEFNDATAATPSFVSTPVRAPQPPPRPVSLPADAATTLPRALSVAASETFERSAFAELMSAQRSPLDVDLAQARQQALVLPGADGMLSLRQELSRLEEDMGESPELRTTGQRVRERAAALWVAVSARPIHIAVVGAAGLALLLVPLMSGPRAAEGDMPAVDQKSAAYLASHDGTRSSTASGVDAHATQTVTAAGSIDTRAVQTSAASPSSSGASRSSESLSRNADRTEAESAPSLEIGRGIHAPVADVVVKSSDSALRVSDPTPKSVVAPFTKQFWTAETKKEAVAESSSAPTSAKIVGALPQPLYPEFLRKNGVEGEVVVQFLVDEKGRPDVSSLEVIRSPHDALTAAVRNVVGRIQFAPALTAGPQPRPRTEVVRISYQFKSTK